MFPEHESEACTVLAGIIPFLRYHYPDHAERFNALFTPGAVERSSEASWDQDSYAVIMADDGILENLDDIDAELNIQPSTSSILVEGTPQAAAPIRPNLTRLGGYTLYGAKTDSVSTIDTQGTRSRRSTARTSQPTRSRSRSRSPSALTHNSAPTATSSVSLLTLDERVASMEQHLSRVMLNLENFMAQQTNNRQISPHTAPTPAIHRTIRSGNWW